MNPLSVYFCDLTHTAQGITSSTFPLGVSYVMSYAQQELAGKIQSRLFKFPYKLVEALEKEPPSVLCMSNYSWNLEISYKIAELAKERIPGLVVIFGGPNFPLVADEKRDFLSQRPAIDFYVELEGELGLVDLLGKLLSLELDAEAFKREEGRALNTNYLHQGVLKSGQVSRIRDLSSIPSPYLSGTMDPFFELPLIPMIESTRGCPFSCSFCADGMSIKNKVVRYVEGRTDAEIDYIAQRVSDVDELIIADLNFAMYKQDLKTASSIEKSQQNWGYPKLISASAGKNKPKRTIEVAGIIKGWTLGASIQSTAPDVLKAIKRSNISEEAYRELIDYGNSLEGAKTHSEIILALPGDTRDKHFHSLRFGIENKVNSIRMFQAILLAGTDMATAATREKYGLETRIRTIPGCAGIYTFFGEKHPISEFEEIIVGSHTLSLEGYLDCRIMNLFVETFYNNAIFNEMFSLASSLELSVFDCIRYLKEHPELYPQAVQEIVESFTHHTMRDLYVDMEEARNKVLCEETIEQYLTGTLGVNELLMHRALLYGKFEEICTMLTEALRKVAEANGKLTDTVNFYLEELRKFTTLRKHSLFEKKGDVVSSRFDFDFEKIDQLGYNVTSEELDKLHSPQQYQFFHSSDQKKHIANLVRIYSNSSLGIGRLIQRSNMKLLFRSFRSVN
jgi:radical SAM superfamily enzyme YgiQ (UPF0313 family)